MLKTPRAPLSLRGWERWETTSRWEPEAEVEEHEEVALAVVAKATPSSMCGDDRVGGEATLADRALPQPRTDEPATGLLPPPPTVAPPVAHSISKLRLR